MKPKPSLKLDLKLTLKRLMKFGGAWKESIESIERRDKDGKNGKDGKHLKDIQYIQKGNHFCINCVHLLKEEDNGIREWIWYNLFCKATPREIDINPVTGRYDTDIADLYENCRDVNIDGRCSKYKGKYD